MSATSDERRRVRVLVVDDHPVSLLGLVAILGSHDEFEVVGEAGSVAAAIVEHRRAAPDVALVDLCLPDGTALDVIDALRADDPGARVLILTGTDAEERAYRALKLAGANGYLLKSASTDELMRGIRAVARGERVVAPEIERALAVREQERDLTPRELEVLELVASGHTNSEIGVALSIALGTARAHVSSILEKLGAADRAEVTAIAIRRGIL